MRQGIARVVAALSQFDWVLIGAVLFLIVVGLVMQYSIGINQEPPDISQFTKQLSFVFVGLILFVIASLLDNRYYRTHPAVYGSIAVLLLILVLIFGKTIKGTTGWFVIGGFSLQPVEFVKVLVILFFATYLTKGVHHLRESRYLLTTLAFVATCLLLIALQPDLGSAAVIFVIWFGLLIALRVKGWILAAIAGSIGLLGTVGWFLFLEQYQKDRLTTFLYPDKDPLGIGYNITQSIVSVGSGGIWGRGLGLGTQSQLHFLPEVNSDFIFAAIAEELGFFGAVAILIAIGLVLYRLWRTAGEAKDAYSAVLLICVFIYIAFQSVLTIGMNIGVLPVTGLPLPLVSAGGTSMVATLLVLGLAHRIYVRNR